VKKKQLPITVLLALTINLTFGQTLDQDFITGITGTTNFGSHPLGEDNNLGQSFTPGITIISLIII
jgi:hypothetical protein